MAPARKASKQLRKLGPSGPGSVLGGVGRGGSVGREVVGGVVVVGAAVVVVAGRVVVVVGAAVVGGAVTGAVVGGTVVTVVVVVAVAPARSASPSECSASAPPKISPRATRAAVMSTVTRAHSGADR